MRKARQFQLAQAKRAMQEAARTRSVYKEFGDNAQRLAVARALEPHFRAGFVDPSQFGFIEVVDAELVRLLHEKVIEVGSVPVRVSDFVVRAGGNEKLFIPAGRSVPRVLEVVVIERKAALQAAGEFGMRLLPCAPFGERAHRRQIVTVAELFEEEIGERG